MSVHIPYMEDMGNNQPCLESFASFDALNSRWNREALLYSGARGKVFQPNDCLQVRRIQNCRNLVWKAVIILLPYPFLEGEGNKQQAANVAGIFGWIFPKKYIMHCLVGNRMTLVAWVQHCSGHPMAVAGLLLAPRSAIIIQVGLRLEKKRGIRIRSLHEGYFSSFKLSRSYHSCTYSKVSWFMMPSLKLTAEGPPKK